MTVSWDPAQYQHFSDERTRPFADLLARVDAPQPASVVDLGCGPGNASTLLWQRWPDARILGVDSSPEMVAAAQAYADGQQRRFILGDVASWRPAEPVDVIVSNAMFQWVPGHAAFFGRLLQAVRRGGWFAFQVPGNSDSPAQLALYQLARSSRWSARLDGVARSDQVLTPAEYLDVLAGLGCRVDVWETTYLHLLAGDDAVLEWIRGTTLRPILTALGPEAQHFENEYRLLLRDAYPSRPWGTVYPFRRIFAVAQRL